MINRIKDAPATIRFPRVDSHRSSDASRNQRPSRSSKYNPKRGPQTKVPTHRVHFPRPPYTQVDGITYKLAETRDEREQSFRLVHDSYVEAQLIQRNAFGMRITPYHFEPTTDIFIAKDGGKVIHTMSLVGEGDRGLPLEAIYEHEVAQLREQLDYFAEVSCLASDRNHFEQRRMFDVFTNLVGLMFRSAQFNGIAKLLIAVHPRHARFYKRMLGFEQFGPQRSYSSVQGNPAIACIHEFDRANANGYRLHDAIYNVEFPQWQLRHSPLSIADESYFAAFGQSTDLALAAA